MHGRDYTGLKSVAQLNTRQPHSARRQRRDESCIMQVVIFEAILKEDRRGPYGYFVI